ncbi:lamin tail domain-containing protein [Candidatus Wolfebacteria bacterium]|nr:lamin tail domain-containing protein [Candidatus Wolfebacteria bacterium]
MRSAFLAIIFLGIMSLAGFGAYLGIKNSATNGNFTNFVGSVELSGNSGLENYGDQEKNQWTALKQNNSSVSEKKISEKNSGISIKKYETKIFAKTATTTTTIISVSTSSIFQNSTLASEIIIVSASSTQNQTPQNAGLSAGKQAQLPAPLAPLAKNYQESSQRIIISEIMVGSEASADYEFIELYNPNDAAIDLTGWSIKKRNSKNNEETFISAKKFKDKKIMPNKYLLLTNEGGYNGNIQTDIFWPKSYSLAYKNNAVVLYNADGKAIEDIGWDEIAKGRSLERILQNWASGEFKIQPNPNPQNSQSNPPPFKD